MAWSASKIFVSFIEDALENTAALDLNSDTFKCALFDNDITPDNTVSTANSTLNAGQWTQAGNEVSDGTNWDAGGEPITTTTFAPTAAVLKFDGDNTPQGGATCTLANVYGGFVHDSSVGNQGVSFHYFGGVNGVTAGTFSVVWHTSGIFTLTLT
jgi:hypothetical protein